VRALPAGSALAPARRALRSVQSDDHLLRCYRYLELNPVRAAMVATPAYYRWSSHAANALGHSDPLLTPHHGYLALGFDQASRLDAYRTWVADAVSDEELELIRLRLQRQHAFGTHRFREMIEDQLQRRVGPAKIGRPRKQGAGRESTLWPLFLGMPG